METTRIRKLEIAFFKAVKDLRNYREQLGFVPKAKVICKFQDQPEKIGVISDYGDSWAGNQAIHVPVIIGRRIQPWSMSDLRIAPKDK